MGNSPSSNNEPSKGPSTRTDHPRNLLKPQRSTAAAAEPSLAQARGTTATHRPRNSQSIPSAHFSRSSPSQSINSPSHQSSDSQMGTQQSKEDKVVVHDQPSKPVDVPIPTISTNETSSLRSNSQSIE